MDNQAFYTAVGATDFVSRYYDICSRFPPRTTENCKCRRSDVTEVVTALGRNARWDRRDNSYSLDTMEGTATVHSGFVLQKWNTVEFWFWIDDAGSRIGSNYATIAHEAAKAADMAIPNPPYPRPVFATIHDLSEIIRELLHLADGLFSLFVKMKGKKAGGW